MQKEEQLQVKNNPMIVFVLLFFLSIPQLLVASQDLESLFAQLEVITRTQKPVEKKSAEPASLLEQIRAGAKLKKVVPGEPRPQNNPPQTKPKSSEKIETTPNPLDPEITAYKKLWNDSLATVNAAKDKLQKAIDTITEKLPAFMVYKADEKALKEAEDALTVIAAEPAKTGVITPEILQKLRTEVATLKQEVEGLLGRKNTSKMQRVKQQATDALLLSEPKLAQKQEELKLLEASAGKIAEPKAKQIPLAPDKDVVRKMREDLLKKRDDLKGFDEKIQNFQKTYDGLLSQYCDALCDRRSSLYEEWNKLQKRADELGTKDLCWSMGTKYLIRDLTDPSLELVTIKKQIADVLEKLLLPSPDFSKIVCVPVPVPVACAVTAPSSGATSGPTGSAEPKTEQRKTLEKAAGSLGDILKEGLKQKGDLSNEVVDEDEEEGYDPD